MCFYPIRLKSGEVVPCGHCEECYSARRNDWSVRLQLHTLSYNTMPLFLTLTYDNDHLPEEGLNKKHLQDFIKRIRDKYDLYDTDFSYFGCGEYGDLMGRCHYHLLLFGMPEYEMFFNVSDELCNKVIEEDWKQGECFVCRADWSGIHYVTKYVLKFLDKDWNSTQNKPFTACSKGIGFGFVNTSQWQYIKRNICLDKYRDLLATLPSIDMTSPRTILSTTNVIINALSPFVEPLLKITLPSGKKAPLPRYFRKKLYGSFEHWKFNPLCYYRMAQRWNRYAKDTINGVKTDRILPKQQSIHKKMMSKGHLVKPTKHFNVK